jgi:molybdopterin converting factor subunit 1
VTDTFRLPVLLFGRHREIAGRPVVEVDLPTDATVRDLRAVLSRDPDLGSSLRGAAVAVNQRYEGDEMPLRAGDEVALIPPVAGG